jgi:methionyl-tRNA formyltransferase
MRLVLMGTGAFALPAFRALVASDHHVAALVTRPVPPPRGRQKGPVNPVLEAFAESGIPVLCPQDINQAAVRQELSDYHPDLFVVCDYGQILSRETLQVARLGGINLHASLLPKYRGAAPINWAIWMGETETGVSVIHMTPRLDSGPCLAVVRSAIGPDEDAAALERRLAERGVAPVFRALELLESWDGISPLGIPQDPSQATRAPRLTKKHGEIDWSQPADKIANQVRALRPWPGAYTQWLKDPHPLHLLLEQVSVAQDRDGLDAVPPGTVADVSRDVIVVAAGRGGVAIHRLKPAGKRVMGTGEFLRGHAVRAGDRFGPLAEESEPDSTG